MRLGTVEMACPRCGTAVELPVVLSSVVTTGERGKLRVQFESVIASCGCERAQ